MRFSIIFLVILVAIRGAVAAPGPLTAKEVGLMLRSGYSSEAILQDLATRKFADQFDTGVENQLVKFGAKPALIEALRSGQYQASPSERAATKARLAPNTPGALALTQQQPITLDGPKPELVGQMTNGSAISPPSGANEASKPTGTLKQQPAPAVPPPDNMIRQLKGNLVCLQHGSLANCDENVLENKKFFLLFFSNNAYPPARKFTSQLIEFYNRIEPEHPEFEVIFYSADRSQYGMETYMTQTSMPWPAVAYEQLSGPLGQELKDMVKTIPTLIFVEGSGRVISQSPGRDREVTPEQVLSDVDLVLAKGVQALDQKKN